MKSRRIRMIGISAALLAAVAVAFLLLRHPARQDLELLELLPPDLDLYVVADLQSLAANPLIRKLLADTPGFARDEEYERFVRATGFRYENDLKRLALAKAGPDWVGAARINADRSRIIQYLESQGAMKADESGKTVFTFGRSRPFRLVFLDANSSGNMLVAFAAGGDAARIRQVVERLAARWSDSGASELERDHHLTHIPQGSRVWLVGKADRLLGTDEGESRLGSLGLNKSLLRGSKTFYVSVEGAPAQLYFRVENYCDSPSSAQRIAGSVQGILALLQAVSSVKAAPADKSKAAGTNLKSLLAAISVEQVRQSVFLQWQWDEGALSFLEQITR